MNKDDITIEALKTLTNINTSNAAGVLSSFLVMNSLLKYLVQKDILARDEVERIFRNAIDAALSMPTAGDEISKQALEYLSQSARGWR